MSAPTAVPMASHIMASRMRGMLPSLSIMPALLAVPTRVPMVSNISTREKLNTIMIMEKMPPSSPLLVSTRPEKSSLNRP